jgi:ABC-2 type transport system ATP-binding protein
MTGETARESVRAFAARTAAPAIRTEGLSKTFGAFEAVRGVTFEIRRGEIFGLLGPNGAGKSTLIRILTTLLRPTSGTAFVGNHEVQRDPTAVRRAIGVIPQAFTSDPDLTAAENLEFYARLYSIPRARRRPLIADLLADVELADWRDRLVGTFSGGMRRRLEIARGLLHRPSILFLDEPTTGLDPASRIAMWNMIRRLKAQTEVTIFLTTHYMEEADALCSRLAFFDRGAIVAVGSPAELKGGIAESGSIDVRFESTPLDWRQRLLDLPAVREVSLADGACTIDSADRLSTVEALMALARRREVPIADLALRGTTLDDLFLRFAGKAPRDTPGSAAHIDVSHLYDRGAR